MFQRCCLEGVTPQFSLGFVDLKHGVNNLFPIIQPFPDWRVFVDSPPNKNHTGASGDTTTGTSTEQPTGTPPDGQFGTPADKPTETAPGEPTKADEPIETVPDENSKTVPGERNKAIPNDPCEFVASVNETVSTPPPQVNLTAEQTGGAHRHQQERIVNAVDAFLDEHGRLLWVLDTGVAGEDACYGNSPQPGGSQSTNDSDTDDLLPPKFIAIDVHANEVCIDCIFRKYPVV